MAELISLPEEIVYKTSARLCSGRIRDGKFLYYVPKRMKKEAVAKVIDSMRPRLEERLRIASRSLAYFLEHPSDVNDNAALRKMAEEIYTRKYPALDFPLTIKFRRQKTVMGTYRRRATGEVAVYINSFFKNAPLILLEYIISHELSHHHFTGHDRAFYAELGALCQNHRQKRQLANQFLTLKEAKILT